MRRSSRHTESTKRMCNSFSKLPWLNRSNMSKKDNWRTNGTLVNFYITLEQPSREALLIKKMELVSASFLVDKTAPTIKEKLGKHLAVLLSMSKALI